MNLSAKWMKLMGPLVVALALALTPAPATAQKVNATFKVVCVADPQARDITGRQACLNATPIVSFGQELTLAVEHAREVDFDDATEPNPSYLVLFLDGKALPGTRASVGKSQLDSDGVTTTLLTYRITRDLSSQAGRTNWKEVLVAAQNRHILAVSTGLENGAAASSQAEVEFQAVRPARFYLWFLVALLGGIIFFWIALKTNALRDGEPDEDQEAEKSRKGLAFSLARVQMAVWTLILLYSYVFIYFLTGEYLSTIPASAVTLMGISLATLGTAAAIDAAKVKENKAKLRDLEEQRVANPDDAEIRKEIAQLKPRTKVCKSDHFYTDILTSADGVSLHRLQFIVWTIALAAVFIVTVKQTLAMPDFDATLLALMGLTSGTYAGLKLPEAKT